jgi:peptidoglycan DL-endopeptidase CwlO
LAQPSRRRVGLLVGLTALLVASLSAPAIANPIDDKRAQAAQIAQQLADQNHQVEILDEQYNQSVLHANDTQAALTTAQAQLQVADANLTDARQRLAANAVDAYVHGGTTAVIDQLVASNGRDLPVRKAYAETATGDERQAVDTLHAAVADLRSREAALQTAQSSAHDAVAQVASSRAATSAMVDTQRATLAQVQGQLAQLVAQQQAQLAAAQQAKAKAELAARASSLAPSTPTSGGGHSSPGGAPTAAPVGPPPPAAAGAQKAVATAEAQLGKPYQWGGAGPDSFDCSGLTMYSWAAAGVSLAHSAATQYDETSHVPIADLAPGDLVFFGSPPYHVGMFVGNGQMIDAPHTGANVEYDSIYWADLLPYGGRP